MYLFIPLMKLEAMTTYLSQVNFLSSYSHYRYSLLGRDAERIEWARLDAAQACKIFLDLCENNSTFEPALAIARQFSFAGAHATPPEYIPFLPEASKEPLPWEKKPKVNTGGELSKSEFLTSLSKVTGVDNAKRLHDAMVVARQTMRKENGRFIYTDADVTIAAKFLKP